MKRRTKRQIIADIKLWLYHISGYRLFRKFVFKRYIDISLTHYCLKWHNTKNEKEN